MGYLIILLPSLLLSWTLTLNSYLQLPSSSHELIRLTKALSAPHRISNEMVAILLVETMAGTIKGKPNHICGPFQTNAFLLRTKYDLLQSTEEVCDILESSPYMAIKSALDNFLYWVHHSSSIEQAVLRYNRGWYPSSHDTEYLSRYYTAIQVIREYDDYISKE